MKKATVNPKTAFSLSFFLVLIWAVTTEFTSIETTYRTVHLAISFTIIALIILSIIFWLVKIHMGKF